MNNYSSLVSQLQKIQKNSNLVLEEIINILSSKHSDEEKQEMIKNSIESFFDKVLFFPLLVKSFLKEAIAYYEKLIRKIDSWYNTRTEDDQIQILEFLIPLDTLVGKVAARDKKENTNYFIEFSRLIIQAGVAHLSIFRHLMNFPEERRIDLLQALIMDGYCKYLEIDSEEKTHDDLFTLADREKAGKKELSELYFLAYEKLPQDESFFILGEGERFWQLIIDYTFIIDKAVPYFMSNDEMREPLARMEIKLAKIIQDLVSKSGRVLPSLLTPLKDFLSVFFDKKVENCYKIKIEKQIDFIVSVVTGIYNVYPSALTQDFNNITHLNCLPKWMIDKINILKEKHGLEIKKLERKFLNGFISKLSPQEVDKVAQEISSALINKRIMENKPYFSVLIKEAETIVEQTEQIEQTIECLERMKSRINLFFYELEPRPDAKCGMSLQLP